MLSAINNEKRYTFSVSRDVGKLILMTLNICHILKNYFHKFLLQTYKIVYDTRGS